MRTYVKFDSYVLLHCWYICVTSLRPPNLYKSHTYCIQWFFIVYSHSIKDQVFTHQTIQPELNIYQLISDDYSDLSIYLYISLLLLLNFTVFSNLWRIFVLSLWCTWLTLTIFANRSLWVRTPLRRCVLDITLCDKVFVSDLRQIGGFLRVLRFPPPINLTATI